MEIIQVDRAKKTVTKIKITIKRELLMVKKIVLKQEDWVIKADLVLMKMP